MYCIDGTISHCVPGVSPITGLDFAPECETECGTGMQHADTIIVLPRDSKGSYSTCEKNTPNRFSLQVYNAWELVAIAFLHVVEGPCICSVATAL